MGNLKISDFRGRTGLAVLAVFLVPLFVFAVGKAVLNTNLLGTDEIQPIWKQQLRNVGSRISYAAPMEVFGDLTDGMFPAAKVYEDGKRLGASVDWHGDVFEQGKGRIFHQEHKVLFSTSDNTDPRRNYREYAVGYNPLAWLNQDWISFCLLALIWLGLSLFKGNGVAAALRSSPAPWLVAVLFDRFVTFVSSPNFTLSHVADSGSYVAVANNLSSMDTVLSGFRTVGYPLFYALVPDSLIPAVQLGLFFGAVFVLFMAVRAFSGNGWVALLACLPMATLNNAYRLDAIAYSHLLLPDALTLAMGMYAIGFCLLFLADEGRPWLWLGLCALTTFYACLLKPSYLFLIVCIPGIAVGWLVLCRLHDWRQSLCHRVFPVILAVGIPLVLFCGFRLVMVGDFGLASTGGRQIIGMAGNFLDAETADKVSEELRPFARDVAEIIRVKKALAPQNADGETLYKHIFRNCDYILYGNGELTNYCSGLECDTKLGALSREILTLHADKYATWLYTAAGKSMERVTRLGRWYYVVMGGLGLAFAFFIAALVRAKDRMSIRDGLLTAFGCDTRMMLWTFACLSVASILVVILVTIPYSRYLLPSRIFYLPLCLYLIGTLAAAGKRLWDMASGR